MYPPIYAICAADETVQSILGTSPVRLYPFDKASQKNMALPYAVWQTISGVPENCMGEVPDIDRFTLQIDVYASTGASVRTAAEALRDAIEPVAYIIAWRGESTDKETGYKRFSFDVEWHVPR